MNKKLLSGRFVWLLLVLVGAGLQADLVLAQTGKSRAAKSRGRAALLPPADGKASAQAKEGEGGDANRIVREGLVVDFNVTPAVRRATGSRELMEGEHVEVSFRITDAANGQPVSGLYPAAWIDISKPWGSEQTAGVNCKDRVALYLQGSVGFRPMVDLNSYFVLVMNRDATISVIDPLVGITGITQLYAMITLKRPGADWVKSKDNKRLFVTMPQAHEVAVVNADTFKVIENLPAGRNPMRIGLQPDEKYLWVGNDSPEPAESGVTVIDVETRRVVGRIPTGAGHHEIALSADSRYAYVTNRKDGTVSVIDVRKLEKVKDIKTGELPISLAFSPLSQSLYVADGEDGYISVVDSERLEVVARIDAKPGLGPLRFSQDGRWGVAVNSKEDVAYVIDASTNTLAHTIPVGNRPYQVAFSRSFAYVRSLGSERVHMINLSELGKGTNPPVVTFAAGEKPPAQTADLSIADAITETPGEAAVLVVSPTDKTVYYYMEGMNAPMGALRNYGHLPRAVAVIDRALQEKGAGVYSGNVRIPAAGTYDVAFLLDTPRLLHCFSLSAKPNPLLKRKVKPLAIEYLLEEKKVAVGEAVKFRFKLTDPATDQPRAKLTDVSVLYYLAPGQLRTVVSAQEVEKGIYEAELAIRRPGAYYVYVGAPSLKVRYDDLPYTTLRAVRDVARARATAQSEKNGEEKAP